MSLTKWPPGGHIGFFSVWTLQVAWFPELTSRLLWNFNCKFHMHAVCGYGPKPIDFHICDFQNGRLVAILDFSVSGLLTLVWLSISTSNFSSKLLVYKEISLLFSAMSLSKWSPGSHIGFFRFRLWHWTSNPTSGAHDLCVWVDRSLAILNDVQLQFAYCPLLPLMLGRGILVDHWSTIYSFSYPYMQCMMCGNNGGFVCLCITLMNSSEAVHRNDGDCLGMATFCFSEQLLSFWCVRIYWFINRPPPPFCDRTAIPLIIFFSIYFVSNIAFMNIILWVLYTSLFQHNFQCTCMLYLSLSRHCVYVYSFIYWKAGISDLLVLMLFVQQCTNYE